MFELTPTPTLEITVELKMAAGDKRKSVLFSYSLFTKVGVGVNSRV